jgi:small GTP-binding protein
VGKSSLLSALTSTKSEINEREFTTLTCVPGNLIINEAKIQLLDLPGIVEGAASGRGNGRQVLAVAKASDLLLVVLEPLKGVEQKIKIMQELHAIGIRANRTPPNISISKKMSGGINLSSSVKLTKIDNQLVKVILHEYKIMNADVIIREDCTTDDLIDAIEGNRKYIEVIFVYNKIDTISIEDVDELSRRPNSLVISVSLKLNFQYLLECIWEKLGLVRVYTKKKGHPPDFEDPIILTQGRRGCTVRTICDNIHKDFVRDFKSAMVWGRSAKFSPQTCGLNHELMDEDVIQLVINRKNKAKTKKKDARLELEEKKLKKENKKKKK